MTSAYVQLVRRKIKRSLNTKLNSNRQQVKTKKRNIIKAITTFTQIGLSPSNSLNFFDTRLQNNVPMEILHIFLNRKCDEGLLNLRNRNIGSKLLQSTRPLDPTYKV